MQRSVLVTGVSALLLLGGAGPALAAPAVDDATCTEAFAAGVSNIPAGTPGYRPALDRDDDGFACDQGDPANTAGAAEVADEIADEIADEEVADGGQVSVIPVGSAPTGDGSRADVTPEVTAPEDGLVTPSVVWWSVTGLVLVGVAALRARYARPASSRR